VLNVLYVLHIWQGKCFRSYTLKCVITHIGLNTDRERARGAHVRAHTHTCRSSDNPGSVVVARLRRGLFRNRASIPDRWRHFFLHFIHTDSGFITSPVRWVFNLGVKRPLCEITHL
jgi:hypothetical protein